MEEEVYPLSTEELQKTIDALETQYYIVRRDPRLAYDAEQLNLAIKNLKIRKEEPKN